MKKLLSILLAVSLLFALAVPAFAEGEQVRNAYSGETGIVQNGQVVLQQPGGHVALIEKMKLLK